jgi:hypothetical protein
MDELQEMREQMAALKEKLNKQEIITEDNWRKLVNQKIHRWKVNVILRFLALPALVLFTYYSDADGRIFQPIAWAILGITFIIYSIRSMLLLKKQDIMSGNLRDVLHKLHQMRTREKGPLTYIWAIALPIIFLGDALIEICQTGKAFGKHYLLLIAFGILCVLIYALSHKYIFLKRPSQWDEYIRQLEEIAELDEENQEDESPIGTNS